MKPRHERGFFFPALTQADVASPDFAKCLCVLQMNGN